MNTNSARRPFRARAAFVSFDVMSDADQVAHLFHAHGFDENFGYESEDGRALDGDQVAELHRSRGRDGRAAYHAEDHADSPDLACRHTHDKIQHAPFIR